MASAGDSVKSPLEHVWRQFIPQGHDNALQNAFYNVAAGVFVVGAAAAAWSVYLILQPFVQSLMWAVLFGSVLHPIKYKLSNGVRRWLLNVQETKSLLSLSLALSPITCLDSLSEYIGWYVMNHVKGVIVVTVVLPIFYIIIHHTPTALSRFAYAVISINYYAFQYFLEFINYINYLVVAVIIVYFVIVMTNSKPEILKALKKFSLPMWILSIASFSCMWSSISVPLFIVFSLLLIGGLWTEVADKQRMSPKDNNIFLSIVDVIQGIEKRKGPITESESHPKIDEINNEKELFETSEKELAETTEKEKTPKDEQPTLPTTPHLNVPRPKNLLSESSTSKNNPAESDASESNPNEEEKSNVYLKSVFIACILVELWRHSYLLSLLPLSLGYYCIKKVASHHVFGEGFFRGKVNDAQETALKNCQSWFESRRKILLPLPLRGVFKLLKRTDIKLVDVLCDSVDSFVTILIMLAVLVFFIMTSIFLAVQIQGEGMHLISMGSQVINATIVNNPQFHELLPEGMREFMDSTLDNGYLYGREWISNMLIYEDGKNHPTINASKVVRGMLGETSEEKAEALEKQVIQLWDRIYQAWVVTPPEPPYNSPAMTTEAVAMTFDSIVDGFLQTPGLISFATLSDVVRDNLGTVMSVLEGIWTILLSNLSLALSAFTATSSVLLGGSLSILNAFLNIIVFLSALFYILSVSDSVYKPVAVLSGLAPGQMNSLGATVEESVNGVFKASFKMGAFYGMWTWLLHSVFATNIVYIPAVLGALFGAVPLVGTYWAAIPGALELFWGHGSPFMALTLVIFQLLPLIVVDTAFYAEIKGGGHPYLTGLAVAGGIFCWGVAGAILGPLLLCILLVVTKMYSSLIQSPSDGMLRFKKFRRSQSEFVMMN